ncbi:hypothetical protein L2E82_10662 [Cichorium intybus]|uniref:Uncharacterized protein n=1 Tax=Cichorium intybus TaxID=13427 RepID=A0ACB9GC72_CICIN|nr:hypothetical protein L2E82_10662 [Cichorium intybus]
MAMVLDQSQEKEKLDQVDLVLPGKQSALSSEVARSARKAVKQLEKLKPSKLLREGFIKDVLGSDSEVDEIAKEL